MLEFYIQIIFSENLAVYEVMWKKYDTARQTTDDNTIQLDRPQMTIRYS
jgi:hypothetical protein